MSEAMKEVIFSALAAADAGPVPDNYARDHGYRRTGTHGYVTDNDWHAFRADAVLAALSRAHGEAEAGKDEGGTGL